MTALSVLLLCALVPQLTCRWAKTLVVRQRHPDPAAQHRLRVPYRRAALTLAIAQLLAAWVAGCLSITPELVPRFQEAATIGFGALCLSVAFTSCAIVHPYGLGDPLPRWETVRRSVRWSVVLVTPILLSYAIAKVVLASSFIAIADGLPAHLMISFASVACVAYTGILVARFTGVFSTAPAEVQSIATSVAKARNEPAYKVLTLPSVQRVAFHIGALPWLRSLLLTDTLVERLSDDELGALIAYECYLPSDSRWRRTWYWTLGVCASAALFFVCLTWAAGETGWFAASWGLAGFLSTRWLWQANRHATERGSRFVFTALKQVSPPTFAKALRQLQPHHRQLLPVTSRQPLRPELYDRLFALGHNPGPPPATR